MTKILISSLPATGHVTPLLAAATELVARGHDVVWHCGPEAAADIQQTGAQFAQMRHATDVVDAVREAEQHSGLAAANAALTRLFVAPMLGQLSDYERILRGFPADALLVDMCSLGAALLHARGGPVWASVGINPLRTRESPFYGSGRMPPRRAAGRLANRLVNLATDRVLLRGVQREFARRCRSVGAVPVARNVFDVLMSPYLHLQGTTPTFEFPYRVVPPQVHFVGPMLPPPPAHVALPGWWAELTERRPVAHVSQGTVATDVRELVQPTVEALADSDVLLVVTTPTPEALGAVPANVRVAASIPHALLLPHVDVMVTNGGYNGVKSALAHGVPLVCAGASEDKPEVCSRVAWSGAGVDLRTGSPSPGVVRSAVAAVLTDPSFRARARAVQRDFAGYDSGGEAAALLERLVASRALVARQPEHPDRVPPI